MATATQTLVTADEFMEMDLGEGSFELERGGVIEVPVATMEHSRRCFRSGFILEVYGTQSGLGYVVSNDAPVQTEWGPDTVRGGDICFYKHERWPISEVECKIAPVPPDLIIEVYSPGVRPSRIRAKLFEYLEAGVPMVWVLDRGRKPIAIYRPDDVTPTTLHEEDFIENLPELPGFRCRVAEFFA